MRGALKKKRWDWNLGERYVVLLLSKLVLNNCCRIASGKETEQLAKYYFHSFNVIGLVLGFSAFTDTELRENEDSRAYVREAVEKDEG